MAGVKSRLCFCRMKDETIMEVLDALDDKYYVTKRLLQKRAGLSKAAVENALEVLISESEIEQIYIKHSLSCGRSEIAYRKVD